MKRVLMIAYTIYDWDARVRREAETLASTEAYDVRVLALKTDEVPRDYVVNRVHIQQLNVRKYRGGNPLKYVLSYVAFLIHALRAVTRLANQIDVVHVHNMPNFLIAAAVVPMIQRKTVVLDIHDTMPETFAATFPPRYRKFFQPILNLEERVSCALADRIVTVNEVQRDAIIARQPKTRSKIIVSMNVPDPRLFSTDPSSAMERAPADRFRLVYHGTVSSRLGVELAIEAVVRCATVIPDVQLHILGEGDAKERLMGACAERKLADRIVFHKAVLLDELIPFVAGMDVGIVPLGNNAATDLMLPVKLMECLSLGVAVVAPKLRAIRYYFDDNMLFYFEPDDVESLQAAIIAARDPHERSVRVRNAGAFLRRYDWSVHKAALLDLYRSA